MSWPGTPITASADPSYAQYTAAGGAVVAEDEWPRYCADAWRIIRDVTLSAVDDETDTDVLAKVDDAVFRVADALYAQQTGIVSEKLGSYSYTRGSEIRAADVDRIAIRALSGTGLTYRGIL